MKKISTTDIETNKCKKVLKFFVPFWFDDWTTVSYEVQKGKQEWGKLANKQINKTQEGAFKAGQNLRKKLDPSHKWKIGSNKDNKDKKDE